MDGGGSISTVLDANTTLRMRKGAFLGGDDLCRHEISKTNVVVTTSGHVVLGAVGGNDARETCFSFILGCKIALHVPERREATPLPPKIDRGPPSNPFNNTYSMGVWVGLGGGVVFPHDGWILLIPRGSFLMKESEAEELRIETNHWRYLRREGCRHAFVETTCFTLGFVSVKSLTVFVGAHSNRIPKKVRKTSPLMICLMFCERITVFQDERRRPTWLNSGTPPSSSFFFFELHFPRHTHSLLPPMWRVILIQYVMMDLDSPI